MLYCRQVPNLSQTNLNKVYASQTASIERGGHPDMEFLQHPLNVARSINQFMQGPTDCEEIPCRDVHLARCLQFAMHKFRLSLFAKDLEPGGSTTFCFSIV